MANGEKKKPLFFTHYTISSHATFRLTTGLVHRDGKAYLSLLYKGKAHKDAMKRYLVLRHFTDMELGRFLDGIYAEKFQNDTIAVMGDHGQTPKAAPTMVCTACGFSYHCEGEIQ
ncbi:hypothetical protein GN958_ATG14224 [Phytophthora infestans]|uniref:Sulfatase-like protein n=1 Tax=Phytophthora infestans TaxID=4787 RepID=A0A8S9UB92_PHYIN|nr:hypothetical protein GN958_ATG14224 [Phytophthora infestans]